MPIELNTTDWKIVASGEGNFSPTLLAPNNVSVGDLIVLGFTVSAVNFADGVDSDPVGFTRHEIANNSSFLAPELSLYYKIADASDVTDATNSSNKSYGLTLLDDKEHSYISMRITGHDPATPLVGSSKDTLSSATSLALASINTSASNVLMSLGSIDNGPINELTPPSGMTKQAEYVKEFTARMGLAVATEEITTDGTSGIKTWSWTDAHSASGILFEIQAGGLSLNPITKSDGVTLVPEGTAVQHFYADDNKGTNEVLLETKYTDINGEVTFDIELPVGKVRFIRTIFQENGRDVVKEQFFSD